jgi:hypothetical protein
MTEPMTPEYLAEIRQREQAVPPAPWRTEDDERTLTRWILSEDGALEVGLGYVGNRTEDVGEFIVHAREDIPALLDEVERLRTQMQVVGGEQNHHLVDLREGGWTIQHPLSCRPNLFDCKVNRSAERDLIEPPTELGQFVCGLDDDGRFVVGARVSAGGGPR